MVGAESRQVGGGLRLAELLGALSLATDLANQTPTETALKEALLSVAFGRHLGLAEPDLSDVYYLALLYHVGCMGAAEEVGRVSAGDDGSLRRAIGEADYLDMPQILRLAVTELANHSGPLDRAWAVVGFMRAGADLNVTTHLACCEAAASLAERLGAGPRVNRAIAAALSVSEATAHTHTVNIYAKTGVHTRAGIALFAIEHDLLPVPKINRTVEVGTARPS